MATFSHEEVRAEILLSKSVQPESDIEELIYLAGLKVDEDVTRCIISLLRNGVKPINIFMMLQSIAKKCVLHVESAKEERVICKREATVVSRISDIDVDAFVRNVAKPIRAWALKNCSVDVTPPRKTEPNI